MTWGLIHQVRERARDAASPRVTSAGNRNERKRSGTSVSGREEVSDQIPDRGKRPLLSKSVFIFTFSLFLSR